ncbi:MAG: hypothetical protein ACXADA_25015 [Candidatus Hodarchaeales archaeon]
MDNQSHRHINVAFWLALIFPLGPVIGLKIIPTFPFFLSIVLVFFTSHIPDLDQPKVRVFKYLDDFLQSYIVHLFKE